MHPDWKEFLKLLNSHEVGYVIVGAHALALHGIPRYTRDIDVFVRWAEVNAQRLEIVMRDVLTWLTGLEFEEAWRDREKGELDGIPVAFLNTASLQKVNSRRDARKTWRMWRPCSTPQILQAPSDNHCNVVGGRGTFGEFSDAGVDGADDFGGGLAG